MGTHRRGGRERRSFFYSTALLLTTLAFVYSGMGQNSIFFRVAGSVSSGLLQTSPNGYLSWDGAIPGTEYLIERSSAINSNLWQPYVRVFASNSVVSVRVVDFNPPPGMVLIPGGHFTMGDNAMGLTEHTVIVSPFYIDRFEVTAERMRDIMQWAYNRGKVVLNTNCVINAEGTPKPLLYVNALDSLHRFTNSVFSVLSGRTNHPCVDVTWYGAVAFCNFLSEIEGKELSYSFADWSCDFLRHGFRLPTEAEWEKAARGGFSSQRFPWGDVITHSEANYKSDLVNWYDVSPTRGFHPVFDALYRPLRSSPVGYFEPNGYHLYDMAGNAWEWVWDTSGTYSQNLAIDPTGPVKNIIPNNRIFKGGSWMTGAERVASASHYIAAAATMSNGDIGFRTALRLSP